MLSNQKIVDFWLESHFSQNLVEHAIFRRRPIFGGFLRFVRSLLLWVKYGIYIEYDGAIIHFIHPPLYCYTVTCGYLTFLILHLTNFDPPPEGEVIVGFG